MLKFNETEKGMIISVEHTIPVMESTGFCADENEEKRQNRNKAYSIMSAFKNRLIESLNRRMKACETNLLNHIDTCESSGSTIWWKQKNGRDNYFNIPSYQWMEKGLNMLKENRFYDFLSYAPAVDQMLKALLNDTEQNHEDADEYRYSELVSLLCEVHMFGFKRA